MLLLHVLLLSYITDTFGEDEVKDTELKIFARFSTILVHETPCAPGWHNFDKGDTMVEKWNQRAEVSILTIGEIS